MFLGYTVLQLFCITVCATCNVILPMKYVLYFYISTFHCMCAVFCSSFILCFPGRRWRLLLLRRSRGTGGGRGGRCKLCQFLDQFMYKSQKPGVQHYRKTSHVVQSHTNAFLLFFHRSSFFEYSSSCSLYSSWYSSSSSSISL